MANGTDPSILADAYVNELIQRKVAERRQAPEIQAAKARSNLAQLDMSNPMQGIMSGMNALAKGFTGSETRAADQEILNQKAAQVNFNNQQTLETNRIRNQGNLLKNAQMQRDAENQNIAQNVAQNTAKAKLDVLQKVQGINQTRVELGAFYDKAHREGLITGGTGGGDFQLTEAGKADKEFANAFRNRPNITDMIKSAQTELDKRALALQSDSDRLNDLGQISVAELANNLLNPSQQSVADVTDLNAQIDAQLATDIKGITQGTNLNNNVFAQSKFDLNQDLSEPGKDLLDAVRSNAEDPTEVNRMLEYAQRNNKQFKELDASQQKFIFAQFLKDKKGVGGSKKMLGFDVDLGEWSEDAVDDDLPTYILKFDQARDALGKIEQARRQAETQKTRHAIQLRYSE